VKKPPRNYLQSGFHTSVAGIATVVSLLAYDFTVAFLPRSFDLCTLIIIILVFLFFTFEIILTFVSDSKYKLTFFCLLDVVGALSLVPDMLQLIEGMGLLNYGSGDGANGMNNAGKVGRVARAGGTIKLAKFARIFRVVRLVRVIRLFRISMQGGVNQVEKIPSRPSTVGRLLATKVTQRIVALIIAMVLVLPYLEVIPLTSSVSMTETLQNIERIEPVFSTNFNSSLTSLVNKMASTEQPFLYLRIADIVFVDVYGTEINNQFRTNDLLSHCVGSCDGERMLSEYSTSAQNSIKSGNIIQAQLSMTMCFFVVFAFVLANYCVSNDARELVIKPIERMTKIVHKLASTVCILSNENHHTHGSGSSRFSHDLKNQHDNTYVLVNGSDNNDKNNGTVGKGNDPNHSDINIRSTASLEGLNEAELLEEVMTQMTVALNENEVQGTSSRRSTGMFSRPSSFVSTSSSTPKSRKNSEWKSRFSFAGSAHIYAGESNNSQSNRSSDLSNLTQRSFSQLPPSVRDNVKHHTTLESIETILENKLACKYLRQHMARTLTLENYMFWDEVEKLKGMQKSMKARIFERFIKQSSPNQVNLDSSTRGRIEMLMSERPDVTTLFDDAQKIVMNLMQLNTYIPFLQSDKCRQYVQEASLQNKIREGPTNKVQLKDDTGSNSGQGKYAVQFNNEIAPDSKGA
jgi:hypothetical protein